MWNESGEDQLAPARSPFAADVIVERRLQQIRFLLVVAVDAGEESSNS